MTSSVSPSSYTAEDLFNLFPEIETTISRIRRKEGFTLQCKENPNYLNICLQSRIIHWTSNHTCQVRNPSSHNPYKALRNMINLLAIEYGEKTYNISPISKIKQIKKALSIRDCANTNIFTNEGQLCSKANQQAWRSAILQMLNLLQFYQYEIIKRKIYKENLIKLLPPEGGFFTREDQCYLIEQVLACSFRTSIPKQFLKKMNVDDSSTSRRQGVYFALYVERPQVALEWLNGEIHFTQRELIDILSYAIHHGNVDFLHKLFNKESIQMEETALQDVIQKKPIKKELIEIAFQKKYENLSMILFKYIDLPSPALASLLILAVTLNLHSLTEMMLPHRKLSDLHWEKALETAMENPDIRMIAIILRHPISQVALGDATLQAAKENNTLLTTTLWNAGPIFPTHQGGVLYQAAKHNNKELIETILQRIISLQDLGDAACCAAEENYTEIVKLFWNSGPILVKHQDNILFSAAKHGNTELIQLRLSSPNPLPDGQKIHALDIAKENNHFEEVRNLLKPPQNSLVCISDYDPSNPKPPEVVYYFEIGASPQTPPKD